MQTMFAIDGMFCGGCAHTVERSLLKTDGVNSASVSFVSDMGIVDYDEQQTDPGRIRTTITKLGYSARELSESGDVSSAPNQYLRALQKRIAVAIGFGMWVLIFSMVDYVSGGASTTSHLIPGAIAVVLSLPVLFYSGWPFLQLAWRSVLVRAPGMELLICTAAIIALVLSVSNLLVGVTTSYADTAVMLVGFQLYARISDFKVRRKAQDAVRELIELAPRVARVKRNGMFQDVYVGDIERGEVVRCNAGDVVPVDGEVVRGAGYLQVGHLTGESKLRAVACGDVVEAGSICKDAMLEIRVAEAGSNRVIEQLSSSVRVTLATKSDLMRLADRVAGWLLPVIFVAAFFTFALTQLLGEDLSVAAMRALSVLVVTCPCALALAVPLAISAAVRAAAKDGFILRDPGVLEDGRPIDVVLLDKTGTLTDDNLEVLGTHAVTGATRDDVLHWAAIAEQSSSHPIAKSIVHAANLPTDCEQVASSKEIAGRGISVQLQDGDKVCVGSPRWIGSQVADMPSFTHQEGVTQVLVAKSRKLLGAIDIGHTLRPDASTLIAGLQQSRRRLMIVSGDAKTVVDSVAHRLGIEAIGEQRPEDKVNLLKAWQDKGYRVAFIGDGLNDGPVLAAADLGIAVGGASGLAKSAAAVVLVSGSIVKAGRVIGLVEKGAGIIRQNLFWALIYNTVMVPAAVIGLASPTTAMIAMALSSLTVSANSLRLK